MLLLSFIMPVKDEENYIKDAILSVQNQEFNNWELIVVNDHSSDNTVDIVNEFKKIDKRIILINCPKTGIIEAFNYGYNKSNGKYIKLIGGDDILNPSFGKNIKLLTSNEASYHDAYIVNEKGKIENILRNTSKFKDMDYSTSIRKIMISPPDWAWTIKKNVADKIFPLPSNLPTPHEDIFIGLLIKKYASISYIDKPLYYYRQHIGQFYGGVYNFDNEVVIKRAVAMLKMVNLMRTHSLLNDVRNSEKLLNPVKEYYHFMAEKRISIFKVIKSSLTFEEKMKLIIVKKFPKAASFISKFKSKLKLY